MTKEDAQLFPFDTEWMNRILAMLENGEEVWVVKRTDTNQLMIRAVNLRVNSSNDRPVSLNPHEWVDEFPKLEQKKFGKMFYYSTQDLYPTEALAKKFAPKEIREGGCHCCHHGSTVVPIEIVKVRTLC